MTISMKGFKQNVRQQAIRNSETTLRRRDGELNMFSLFLMLGSLVRFSWETVDVGKTYTVDNLDSSKLGRNYCDERIDRIFQPSHRASLLPYNSRNPKQESTNLAHLPTPVVWLFVGEIQF